MAYAHNSDKTKVEVYAKDDLLYKDVTAEAPAGASSSFHDFGSSALKMYYNSEYFSIPSNAKIISSDVIESSNIPSGNYLFSHEINRTEGNAYGYIIYKMLCPSNSYPTSVNKTIFKIRIFYYLES